MKLDRKMFRAYDIRGTVPDQVNPESALLIGKAFGTYLNRRRESPKATRVVVGRDCRTHSEEIQAAFIEGLLATGCQVTDIGLSPSPFMYFVNTVEDFDGGCNITASHNPAQYNGFKLVGKKAHAVFGDELQKLYEMAAAEDFDLAEGGDVKQADHYNDYLTKVVSMFEGQKPMKVVVDTGNGVGGDLYPKALKQLGHEVTELYTEMDGTFPNHEPDPIVEKNLVDLKKKVLETGADIGLAFDGDADRIGVVTEKGEFMNSDKTLMLLARDVLSRHRGKAIVFTVSNSQALFDLVEEWGGKPEMCKVGHSFVEDAMTEFGAILGGEQSGHFFVPEDYYQYDDALVTGCRILQIIGESGKKASQVYDEFPKTYSEPEMRPHCPDDHKFEVLKKVQEHFKDKYPNSTLDGIRLDFGNGGWCGIRVSNTSPCLSVTMEALSAEHLEEIKGVVMDHLKGYAEIDWSK